MLVRLLRLMGGAFILCLNSSEGKQRSPVPVLGSIKTDKRTPDFLLQTGKKDDRIIKVKESQCG